MRMPCWCNFSVSSISSDERSQFLGNFIDSECFDLDPRRRGKAENIQHHGIRCHGIVCYPDSASPAQSKPARHHLSMNEPIVNAVQYNLGHSFPSASLISSKPISSCLILLELLEGCYDIHNTGVSR